MGQLSCARLRSSGFTVAQSTRDVQLCMIALEGNDAKVEGQRSMPSFRVSTSMWRALKF